jgi:uncharacterized SAM-binding protein YcdF (DUF218 family)
MRFRPPLPPYPQDVLALGLAVAALAAFVAGVIHDRRSFGNTVFLGLALALAALGCAELLGDFPRLSTAAAIGVRLAGYLVFLFVAYTSYALIYSKLPVTRRAGYVVVLGAGLLDGGQVPPLLASRLERGRAVYERLVSGGEGPVLIVSGGKGSDEQVPEAAAMARYLTERGFPAGRLVLEDRSASTAENLLFSKAIMDRPRPGAPGAPGTRCVIVTSGFHAFRAADIARRLGIDGQATGARSVRYFWPGALLREFAAVLVGNKLVNAVVCALIVVLPLAYDAIR